MTISVADVARETAWYTQVLGFTLAPHDDSNPAYLNYHLTIPGYRIDLIQHRGSTRPPTADPLYLHQGWIHIAFSVPDIGKAFTQLQAWKTDVKADSKAGAPPTRLILHDPEGNEIELFPRP